MRCGRGVLSTGTTCLGGREGARGVRSRMGGVIAGLHHDKDNKKNEFIRPNHQSER
jgi:hypothetical protein